MTAVPMPRQPFSHANSADLSSVSTESTPVLALKELVARLHREQHKIQNLLSSLGFALRSFNNLNQFLELTPLMAARVTDAEGGALVLYNANGQVRLEQLHCHDSHICENIRYTFEQVTREIKVQANKTETKGDYVPFPANIDDKIKQYLDPQVQLYSTPILVKNQERGRLYVFSSDKDYIFAQHKRKLVQLVADQTAVAIANHELNVELRARERQDKELEIASEIQRRLLPRKCPKIKGVEIAANCKTASQVGGDYYDFIPANYDQMRQNQDHENLQAMSVPWSIVIGDVMGKGVPAGLIMTMTRGMLRAEVLNRHTPAKIMQHLNRVMYADLENSHRFVTLFYSEYDPETGILSYTNAAHNPPLLWQAANQSIQLLDTKGFLVGLDADSEYEDAEIQLASGDTIIYYTDGFTDAVNQNGDRFDEENLYSAFQWACQHCDSPQKILDYLFDKVQDFVGDNTFIDDMTLVVMQIKHLH